jgi:hypothetical protein
MRTVQIQIGDTDIETLKSIFKNEPDFQPQSNEDRLIVALLRQILENTKEITVESIPYFKEANGQALVSD